MSRKTISNVLTAPQMKEGGGFRVRRPLGGRVADCDPLLMLDHFGPADNAPGEAIGAPDHPHRGFETVTYIIQGAMVHKDSQGNTGHLGPGWVQWMTAGSGVVHAEMPAPEIMKNGGIMEGFQLWVNLPAKDKMIPPRYQDTSPEKIPIVQLDNGSIVKVIAGEFRGVSAHIETRIPIYHLDFQLQPSSSVDVAIPASHNAMIYCWRGNGELRADKTVKLQLGQAAFLARSGELFTLSTDASSVAHFIVVSGEPIGEPVARHGPFVMNTKEEINQAIEDYHNGKLGNIAGAEERYRETAAANAQSEKLKRANKKM